MDLQKILTAQMSKIREEKLSESEQLSLGELKLKLELIGNKSKDIVFDFGMKPAGASSWRGSYCELGLEYSENGGGEVEWNGKLIKVHGTDTPYSFNECETETFNLPEEPTTQNFLDMLNALTNKEMVGYKGDDFKMHKCVSVYLGNYGSSSVIGYAGKEYATVAPFDVIEKEDVVTIITGEVDY